ncbi:thiamine phosphate synthase [Coraliomargarita sp. SDUM461004]|uniref:Thiamine-phosphate synthase n=1 Tax=Thalassobacterium sedimentorum TaxID=3041258 RepID=A0ABU1AL06_9BACT|nr:thiamine phosphate synthase [Coraliomargarita sp. SDUM461004]MDQ8194868.1 thiamine phosphate synthase [Coraliomargarita sp. SDUM461004]
MNWPKYMCLTIDGIERSHTEQVQALCAAGVDWVQLRSKELSDAQLEPIAFECMIRCREIGSTFILNDRLDLALKLGADGVHLGKLDTPWADARARAGADFLIGGTVNSVADAEMVVAAGVLDYVGVGPFKFTHTKKNLAPVLTPADWLAILAVLGELPSYAIGGIEPTDIKELLALGVTGAAICSVLYRQPNVSDTYAMLLNQL